MGSPCSKRVVTVVWGRRVTTVTARSVADASARSCERRSAHSQNVTDPASVATTTSCVCCVPGAMP